MIGRSGFFPIKSDTGWDYNDCTFPLGGYFAYTRIIEFHPIAYQFDMESFVCQLKDRESHEYTRYSINQDKNNPYRWILNADIEINES